MATKKYSNTQSGTKKTGHATEVVVGRKGSDGLDIEIDNPVVSGKHLRVVKAGSIVFIEDLGSSNGTTLNGMPIEVGEQRPVNLDSEVILANREKLDFQNPKLKALFQDAFNSNVGNAGTQKHSAQGTSKHNSFSQEYDKFFPAGYTDKEDRHYPGRDDQGRGHETITIRILTKDDRLRVIVFAKESQELIFNEERSYKDDEKLNGATPAQRKEFFQEKIETLFSFYKQEYAKKEKKEIWHFVLDMDGEYKHGGYFKIVSEKCGARLRTTLHINEQPIQHPDEEIEIKSEDSGAYEIYAREIHEKLSKQYAKEEEEVKFPVSVGWLNAILKKVPYFYEKKSPMHAFWVFISILLIVLYFVICATGKYGSPKLKQGSKVTFKDTITVMYYSSIEEPLCGNLADRCQKAQKSLETGEAGKDVNKFLKKCKGYCFYEVIGKDTCEKMGIVPVEPIAQSKYSVIAPNSTLSSSSGPKAIVFINNINKKIDVTMENIEIQGTPYDIGLIESINGKKEFELHPNQDGYNYEVMFNNSYKKELVPGKYTAKVKFKLKIDNEETISTKDVMLKIEVLE